CAAGDDSLSGYIF
nr:immunoglobulin light chain junction region [Macaca mulatta]